MIVPLSLAEASHLPQGEAAILRLRCSIATRVLMNIRQKCPVLWTDRPFAALQRVGLLSEGLLPYRQCRRQGTLEPKRSGCLGASIVGSQVGAHYLAPRTIELPPASGSVRISRNPASRIHVMQSDPL